jgi:hypothetical protein
MSDLINRVNCPNGCKNPVFTESVKTIVENNSRLLNESAGPLAPVRKIKVYNCTCCGQTFEMHQSPNSRLIV